MGPVRLYRLSARLHERGFRRAARAIKAVIFFTYRCAFPPELIAGPNLRVAHHGLGIVINPNTTLGRDVFIYHFVTLATDNYDPRFPDAPRNMIGDRVVIGAGATVMGPVTVGDEAVIGAGAVVTSDVPPRAVVVGVPARVISYDGHLKQR
jgi:serine O-acetyltransferase